MRTILHAAVAALAVAIGLCGGPALAQPADGNSTTSVFDGLDLLRSDVGNPVLRAFENGRAAYDRGDYEEAMRRMRAALELDKTLQVGFNRNYVSGAYYHIGRMYYSGLGVTKDVDEAMKWYRRAAELGHPEAENALEIESLFDSGGPSTSTTAKTSPPPAVIDENRVALVIGNSAYANAPPLTNPKNDAVDVAAALERLGFTVILEEDLDKRGMDDAFRRFARELGKADAALFYYAGHAMQFEGVNYLVPVDARIEEASDLPYELADLGDVLGDLMETRGIGIAVLDACRNNPLESELKARLATTRNLGITRGLARIAENDGLLVAYATRPGDVAADGDGLHSPFTAALLEHIETPGLDVGLMFRRVTRTVLDATGGRQRPELTVSLIDEYHLAPPTESAAH